MRTSTDPDRVKAPGRSVPEARGSRAPSAAGELLPRPWLFSLWTIVLLVLAAGVFLPDLNYGDAPQYAVMALRMFRDGDWVNLTSTGLGDFLDKPHLIFWSAMVGYHLFGVHDFSYRLPSVLVSLLGAYSVGRLGRRLYGERTGQMAALLFITSQAILLGDHDVRTDALLTGFTAFAVWQLARWIETDDLRSLLAGAVGTGLAVSSKGMVAAAVVGPCILLFAWGRRRLWRCVTPAVLLGLAAFLLSLAPVLLAYALQFDLHPEKTVGGMTGVSGVRYFLLGQSVERFSGAHGEASPGDYLFFFHTLLWAFLPWSLLAYGAWGVRLRTLFREGMAGFHRDEQLTFLWPLAFTALLNLSRFKLPHYLNLLFPLLAVLVAGTLDGLARGGRTGWLRVLERVQWAVIGALLFASAALNAWSFPVRSGWVLAGAAVLLAILVRAFRLADPVQRVWVPSAVAVLLTNFLLNASFFPQLARYQPGSAFARQALAANVDWDHFYFLDRIYRPFQFYTGHIADIVELPRIRREVGEGHRVFVLVGEEGKEQLRAAGLTQTELLSSPDCRITMIDRKILVPEARETGCPRAHLLALGP